MDSRKFFYEMGKALYHLDALYDEFAKIGKIAPSVLWVLYALNDGENHTQKDICENWSLPKSTVNTVIKELENKKYIELIQIKGKRREMWIHLTQKGSQYANEVLDSLYKKEKEIYKLLTSEDKHLIEALNKINLLFEGEDNE